MRLNDRVRSRGAAALAAVAGVTLIVTQIATYLLGVQVRAGPPPTAAVTAFVMLFGGTFLLVGGVVAIRRPRHAVGWLLLAMGTAGAAMSTGGLVHGVGQDPWVRSFGAWLDAGLWHPSFPALGLLFLLFPTSAPPTPRWRWLQWALGGAWALLVVTAPLTTPGLMLEFYPDARPVLAGPWSQPLTLAHDAVQAAVFPLLLASVASLVVRAKRSRGLERQQLKWFAGSVLVVAVMFPISLVWLGNGSLGAPFLVLLPLPCAIAILRYRLYEIDRIISRTVSYTFLTGLLVTVYMAAVFALQQLLRPVAGESQLAVAGATLAVAALFQPARRRIQAVVDRRFNRARYDAQRTVEAFRARLRDEVDLEQLEAEVVVAVRGTVEPARVVLWLRVPERAR